MIEPRYSYYYTILCDEECPDTRLESNSESISAYKISLIPKLPGVFSTTPAAFTELGMEL